MVRGSRSDGPSWPSWKITSKPTDRSSCQRPCDHIYEEWTGSNKSRIERATAELVRTWRGDGAAERAGLENRRPRKGSASSNLAPSAKYFRRLAFFTGHTLPQEFVSCNRNCNLFVP